MMRFLLFLRQQHVIQIFQDRHVLRHRIIEVLLINLMHATIDHSLLHWLQSLFASYHEFTQRQDIIRLQRNRVVFF